MLGHEYFYNGTIKNMVAAFGQMFNDIQIAQLDAGKLIGARRVPLAYAPKEKYLVRVEARAERDVALRLPRMSFEMTGLSFDQSTKLNRLNRNVQTDSEGNKVKVNQCVPYTLDFSLNIMSRGQDEALQILEQIVPHFNPNYTLSVKGLEGPESITDVPITLSGVSAEDAYEGDFESSRRLIVYTLTFSVKTKFTSNPQTTGLIKSVDTFFNDFDTSKRYTDAGVRVRTGSSTDTPESNTVVIEIGGPPDPNVIWDDSP
tara:strand:- start:6191 stop:6967 length:777 start_codon:yes stop_codon:yes gene_type:complete